MLCPNCSRPVADGARFCGSCGKAISAPADAGGTVIRPPSGLSSGPPSGPSSGPPSGGGGVGGAGMGLGATALGPNYGGAAGAAAGIFQRIKNMLLTPKTEWPVIEPESTGIPQLYIGFIIPLAAVSALVSFLQSSVIGHSIPFVGRFRMPITVGLTSAVLSFVFALIGAFIYALIINVLAPTFSGRQDLRQALKTGAYAFVPLWVGSVLYILPLGTLLMLAGLIYGIYVLYLGLPIMMKSNPQKAGAYTAAVIICGIVLGIILGVVSALTHGFGMAGLGGYPGAYGGLNDSAMTQEQRQAQAAAVVANMIGGAVGTNQDGKNNLGAALNNLAKAGQNAQSAAQNSGTSSPGTGSAPDAAPNPQAAAAAGANLLAALGGAMAGGRHVDPVDFHVLKDMLPASLPGMQRSNAEGSSGQAMGMKGSSATGQYQGSGTHAEIKIADASAVAGLMDMATAMEQNTASESDTGFEKTVMIGGRPVHEKYDNRSKHGELNIIVAKRFAVDITGDGVDIGTLEQYATQVDYSRLESMKDMGAHAAQ